MSEQSDEFVPHADWPFPVKAEEPVAVAWMYHGIRFDGTPHERPSLIWHPLGMDAMSASKGVKAVPLYTYQPRRQWQGLTDEEIDGMTCECVDDGTFDNSCAWDYARAIEKALKEKNA